MDRKKQVTLFSSWTCQKNSTDGDSSYAQPKENQTCIDETDEILAKVLEQSLREYQESQNSIHGEGPSHHRNITDTGEEFGIESTPTLPPCRPLETLPGFDLDAGRTWIYPVNYPVRQYQYDIVHKSLFLNTLVALPTGLGKTFIAAVVMYNFYRWYPQGKVIFMAPTKPLVTQQVEACYNVMGIPQADTAEMTGTMNPTNRISAWKVKRMFFLTPQVLTNDLNRGACPTANVCCIVLDEAHRAQGNHAYCQVVRELSGYGAKFRILALSATPGTDIRAVQQVIQNLRISHIELRSEDSPDIAPYTHARNIEKIVVDLGSELTKIKARYFAIVRIHVKRLIDWRAIYTRDETTLSKFQILKAREAFRQNPPDNLPRHLYGVVEGEFALCMTLYHALELLQLHGAKSFHSFLKGTLASDKGNNRARGELLRNSDFLQLMEYVEKKFSPEERGNASSHGSPGLGCKFSSPKSPKAKPGNPYVVSHPKLEKLRNIILEHFQKFARKEQSTRVMIFSQYRDSVKEITDMLQDYQPQVKAMSFVGQSTVGRGARGFSQKEQLKVVKRFREGGYNTLVSTCVGEEGLDIGEVDLIICFDAPKSPIRLVQRMGRTGRKREGRIVVLVTKGKEEQTYNQSQYQKKTIHSALANGQSLKKYLYPSSERMIPKGIQPVCHKLIMKVDAWDERAGKGKKRKSSSGNCGSLFSGVQSGKRKSIASVQGNYLTHEEWSWYNENLQVSEDEIKVLPASCMVALGDVKESPGSCEIQLGEYQPWQTTQQPSHLISHSLKSQHLVELTEFMDLMVTLGPDDDSYGLDIASFFDDKFLESEREVAKDADTPQKKSSPVISRTKRGRKKGVKMKGIQRRIDDVLSQQKKQKTCKDSTQDKESNEFNYSNSNQRFKSALSRFACNQEEEKDFKEVNSNSKPLMSCSSEKEQKEVCHSSQRSCSDGQDIQETAEVVTGCSSSQIICSKDLQMGHLEDVNRSQKSPKKKAEGRLHDSSSHKKENQPWDVMSDLLGLPKVLTRDSTLQIRTPPPDFESLCLDYIEERCCGIVDMIEECERHHCVKMNSNLEKVGIAPVWDSLSSHSSLQETPEREVSATKHALQEKENSMDELPDLMQPSPKIMSKSYSRKFSVSIASLKISPNVRCINTVNSPLKIGSHQSSSKLMQVDKSPEDSKIELKTNCLSPVSPILPTTYRKPFKSNHFQCSSTPKPSVRHLFRDVSGNHDFVQKDKDFEMPSPIIKGRSAPSTAENTKKAKRSLIHDTVSDDFHPIPSSVKQKSQISAKLGKFSAELTSDMECTFSTYCKGQKKSSLHIKPPPNESHEQKIIDAEGYNSNEDLFADDFNIDLTAIERENVEQAKGSLSNACELISSKENLPNMKSEKNSASVFPQIRENKGAPLDASGTAKEIEPVHDNLAVNFELSLGDDLFDDFDYDKDGKSLEEQVTADQDKRIVGIEESVKEGCHPGREKPMKGQTEGHSILTVTQIMDLVNEPSFQRQNEDYEFQNKQVTGNLSLNEKSIGAPVHLIKAKAEPTSTGSQRATKNLQVTSDKEVSIDSELHSSGSCSESLLKNPEKREENLCIVKQLPHVGNSLNFSLLDDFGEVEIMKEALPLQGTAGFEVSSEYLDGNQKITEPKSKLFVTESMSQSLLQDIEMNRNLKWQDVAKKQTTKTDTKLSNSLLHSDEDSPIRFSTKRKITLMSSDEESPKFKKKKLWCRVIHDSSAEGESIGRKDKSNSLCESTISSENRLDTTDNSDVNVISPKVKTVKKAIFISDDEEGVFDTSKTKVYKRRKEVSEKPGRRQKRTKKYKKRPNHYICEEAELSVRSGEEVSEDEEDNSEPNTSDESFVDDNTELTQDEKIDMKAVYLQSVKSPEGLQNKRSVGDAYLDVLSQPDVDDYCTDNDADSFVVSNDCIEYDTEYMGDDMLAEDTIMQKAAVEDLDYKKDGAGTGKGKRRRIILQDSTDCTSEEEVSHTNVSVKPMGNICGDNQDSSCSSSFTSPVKLNIRDKRSTPASNYFSPSPVVSPVKESSEGNVCDVLDYLSPSPANTPVKVKQPCKSLNYLSPASSSIELMQKEQGLCRVSAETHENMGGLLKNRHEAKDSAIDKRKSNSVPQLNKLNRTGTIKSELSSVDSDSRVMKKNQSLVGNISQPRHNINFARGNSQKWDLSQNEVFEQDKNCRIPFDFNRGSKANKVKIKNEVGSDELFHENLKPKGVTGSPAKSEAFELASSQDFMSNSQEITTMNAQAVREARLARQRAKQEEFRQKYALKLKRQNKSPVIASTSDELTSSQEISSQEFESPQKKSANYSFKTNTVSVDSSQKTLANFSLGFSSSNTGLENLLDFGESLSCTKQHKVEIKNVVGSDELFHENLKPKGVTGSPAKSEAFELASSQDFMSNSQEMKTMNAKAAREVRLARQRAKQEEFRQKYVLKLKQQNKSPVVASTSDEPTSSQEFSSQEHESLQNKSANYSFKTNTVSVDSSQKTLANFNLDFSSPNTGDSSSRTRQYMSLAHSAASTSAKPVFTGSSCSESLNNSAASVKDSDQEFLILVDSCEVNGGGSQVISTLRITYKACTAVVQLGHADYAVSRRMGVWRQSLSAFSSSSNKTVLISKVQKMLEMYERPVIIVEKEPTRPSETPRTVTRTRYLDSILCAFCQVGQMKVLHSNGHNETASLIWGLAKLERTKGYHLSISATVVSKLSQTINFYKCLPQISYASAVFLTYTFPNVADFMNCSVIQLEKKTGWSRQRVVAIHQFLHRIFREDMLPS